MAIAVLLACAIWTGQTAAPAHASVVRAMDLAALTEESTLILHAVVRDSRSYWKGDVIVTDVTFEVQERLKGPDGPPTFVLTQMGGIVGDMGMRLEGDARFLPGEEVVVFLEPSTNNPNVNYWVTGMAQGKYVVTQDPATGVKVVQGADLAGVAVVGPGQEQVGASRGVKTFRAFRVQVLELLRGRK